MRGQIFATNYIATATFFTDSRGILAIINKWEVRYATC